MSDVLYSADFGNNTLNGFLSFDDFLDYTSGGRIYEISFLFFLSFLKILMIFLKLKQIKNYIDEKIKEDFLSFFLFLVFIGIIRNMLEMIGYFTNSPNYTGYFPTLSSFFDTISYVFLMIIGETLV